MVRAPVIVRLSIELYWIKLYAKKWGETVLNMKEQCVFNLRHNCSSWRDETNKERVWICLSYIFEKITCAARNGSIRYEYINVRFLELYWGNFIFSFFLSHILFVVANPCRPPSTYSWYFELYRLFRLSGEV